jgi:integrase
VNSHLPEAFDVGTLLLRLTSFLRNQNAKVNFCQEEYCEKVDRSYCLETFGAACQRGVRLCGTIPQPDRACRDPRGPRKRRRKLALRGEPIAKLIRDKELPGHVKSMVMVAVCTGMRVSEVLGLRWEDVSFERSVISMVRRAEGKNVGRTKSDASEREDYPPQFSTDIV